jgi:acyl-coenzyme A synthetase/AMP-(fatty) acid ligase
MTALPLLGHRRADAVFAWLPDGPVTVERFLADVAALAGRLPAGRHLLNVCQDRYRFAVGFAAGLLAGKISLQPSSQSPETLRQLRADYADIFCLADGDFASGEIARFDFPALDGVDRSNAANIPDIPAERVAAILFTSGSTGNPMPHAKTWGKLVKNGQAEAARLGLDQHPHHIVGTVPVQHSYGFESTLLLAMHGGCPFWSGKPFYPQDIAAAMAAVPPPRLLVTTPFHLAALLEAGIDLPAVDLVLSATAPLATTLAATAEQRLAAPLYEIFGSTESGQIASRRTTAGPTWQLLPDVCLEADGDTAFASGGHVEGRVALSDAIELRGGDRFLLHGRHADLVNIAGRRTSLAYLNHQIAAIPGVQDAAFYLPDEQNAGRLARLTAFVVAPGLDSRDLLRALRERIDPVFLPRPLVFVASLPRNSVGKLPRASLVALHEEAGGADRD